MVDRSGAYRLNLPFDTSRDETYEIYKNEIDDTYVMAADTETPTSDIEGLELSNFAASVDEAPLSDAYLAELNDVVTLPESLTLDQLKPQLLAAGIDVDAVVPPSRRCSPRGRRHAERVRAAADPDRLRAVLRRDGGGRAGDRCRGQRRHRRDGGGPPCAHQPAGAAGGAEPLSRRPRGGRGNAAADDLATAPATPLFQYDYEQTPASVADIADERGRCAGRCSPPRCGCPWRWRRPPC